MQDARRRLGPHAVRATVIAAAQPSTPRRIRAPVWRPPAWSGLPTRGLGERLVLLFPNDERPRRPGTAVEMAGRGGEASRAALWQLGAPFRLRTPPLEALSGP
jgi:hypothetical protein